MSELFTSLKLSAEQQHAVLIIKQFIDCYNSVDGTGLFSGKERYFYLESRIKIAATQAKTIMNFWSILREKLQCPIPARRFYDDIVKLWSFDNQVNILRAIIIQASEFIMLARLLCDEEKGSKLELIDLEEII